MKLLNVAPSSPIKKKFDACKKQVNTILYKGNNAYCCVCQSSFRTFRTFAWRGKKKPKCVNCGSYARHRLVWKYLNDNFDLFEKPIKVLHFAPEKIFYDILGKNQNIVYYPCDLNPNFYKHYTDNKKIAKVDITNIPFEDNYFDFIMCNHVLEHVPDDKKAMFELFRVMKKGGFGIFQVPIDYEREVTYEDFSITSPKEREKAFGQFDHVRWYGKDYVNRLEKVGFTVSEDRFVETFSKEQQFKFGFDSSELIYHCKK